MENLIPFPNPYPVEAMTAFLKALESMLGDKIRIDWSTDNIMIHDEKWGFVLTREVLARAVGAALAAEKNLV